MVGGSTAKDATTIERQVTITATEHLPLHHRALLPNWGVAIRLIISPLPYRRPIGIVLLLGLQARHPCDVESLDMDHTSTVTMMEWAVNEGMRDSLVFPE